MVQAASALRFPSKRFTHKAIQAVQVQHGVTSNREHVFTFCLERCDLGPYKVMQDTSRGQCPSFAMSPEPICPSHCVLASLQGCWLVVGVRQGNYAKGM